jgi:hypothetical protein
MINTDILYHTPMNNPLYKDVIEYDRHISKLLIYKEAKEDGGVI